MSGSGASDTAVDRAGTYLSFLLDGQTFATDVFNVREILDLTPVTKVPQMPKYLRGVLEVRGAVVPVVDMRLKFGMEPAEDTVDTRIIVLEVSTDSDVAVIGAVVDEVHDVFELTNAQIDPPPRLGGKIKVEFVKGLARFDDRVLILLRVDRVFSDDELIVVAGMGGDGAEIAAVLKEVGKSAAGQASVSRSKGDADADEP